MATLGFKNCTIGALNGVQVETRDIGTSQITSAKIADGTITSAKLVNSEHYYEQKFSVASVAANSNYINVDGGLLPQAATLVKAQASAYDAANTKVRVRFANLSGTVLVTGNQYIVVPSTPARAGTVSVATAKAVQAATKNIIMEVWTSTTISVTTVSGRLTWKMGLTT